MAERPNLPKGYFWRGPYIWCRTDPVTKGQASTELTSAKGLKKWRVEREKLSLDPRYAAASKATFGEWYVETIKFKRVKSSKKTIEFYEQKLGHFRRIWGDSIALVEIVPDLCDTYVSQRRDEDATDHTIVKEFSCLTQLLKLARRAGKYPHDIESLKPIDLVPGYVPQDRALSVDEVKSLLAFSSRRLRTLVELSVGLATRLAETLRVQPSDIDLDAMEVKIRGTKTDAAKATIPILAPLRSLIEDALPHLPFELTEAGEYSNVRRDLAAACERAGIARCTPNDLRRTHSTLLKEAGVDNDFIRRMLRHTTTRMVEFVYSKPKPGAIADNINPMIETMQLSPPDATKTATIEPWKSRKGIKHRKNTEETGSQLRDLNSRPAVYETGVNYNENSEVSIKQDTGRTATRVETQSDNASRATQSATIDASAHLAAIIAAYDAWVDDPALSAVHLARLGRAIDAARPQEGTDAQGVQWCRLCPDGTCRGELMLKVCDLRAETLARKAVTR